MKSEKELNALKNEVETLNSKLRELTDEELEQVTGGAKFAWQVAVAAIQGIQGAEAGL